MKNIFIILAFALAACTTGRKELTFSVVNHLNKERFETITISHTTFDSLLDKDPERHLKLIDLQKEDELQHQLVDLDGDGKIDELIFQTKLKADEHKKFKLISETSKQEPAIGENRTYARFVPERIDDFAWENDLVAFRTYGPEAQRLVDENQKGGTLSSGMDCWLKRVHYPIIDKWYKKYVDGGTYHKDDGEGYDPYHVGASRGCGGIGVWKKDSLYVSKNFVTHRIIANGPIRTIFELTYAPWKVDSVTVTESKRISIDMRTQLTRYEVVLNTTDTLPNCTVGITLHDKKGEVKINNEKGWYRYWEPIDDSEIGTGVVTDPASVQTALDFRTGKKDLSHILIVKKANQPIVYYAGFAWKKADAITTPQQWDEYLNDFADKLASPVEVVFGK